ncbi:hypothetical protein B0F90DRAFT_1670540 [Multifurca ochricompacta]|uniref:Uncharacterized protein n=1 Tax=Multifurca ochricompacta TaxID=376703 RepID=A0AAD4QH98_9AGAM|nr:hypothetical protein B0F90DRAFT_1670540 [Multifurca ochricompacta]
MGQQLTRVNDVRLYSTWKVHNHRRAHILQRHLPILGFGTHRPRGPLRHPNRRPSRLNTLITPETVSDSLDTPSDILALPTRYALPPLRVLFEHNFPSFTVHALDRDDPALKESRGACHDYALKFRSVKEELQPHAAENEETLSGHIAENPELIAQSSHQSSLS